MIQGTSELQSALSTREDPKKELVYDVLTGTSSPTLTVGEKEKIVAKILTLLKGNGYAIAENILGETSRQLRAKAKI